MSDKNIDNGLEELETELLLEGVRRRYGYDFRNYERAAVRRRVLECMMAGRVSTISRFQEKVLRNQALLERFLRAFANSTVSMFSDAAFYCAFRAKVVPLLKTYPFVRIWHAGCSTGQEVYALAILLEEEGLYQRSRIYATDLSEEAVKQARRGSFRSALQDPYAANYLAAGGKRRFSDYVRRKGGRLVVDPALRNNIVFSEHNLATDGSLNEFQVIICRDILTNFNQVLRDRVDSLIYESLGRFGVLAMGATGSLNSMPHEACYSVLDEGSGLFQKFGYDRESLVSCSDERTKTAAEVRRNVPYAN